MFDFLLGFTILSVNCYMWISILEKFESRRRDTFGRKIMHSFLMSEVLKPKAKKAPKKDKI